MKWYDRELIGYCTSYQDMVSLSRPLIREPDLVNKFGEKEESIERFL